MKERDVFFNQAVVYAKEKNYAAARAMLRNLLFMYPNDVDGLLLYSIVAENESGSIQALKRILQLDPDHEIAFAKLAKLKHALPIEIPPFIAPPPIPTPSVKPAPQPEVKEATPPKYIEPRVNQEKPRKKTGIFDLVLIGLFVIACLCVSLVGIQKLFMLLAANF